MVALLLMMTALLVNELKLIEVYFFLSLVIKKNTYKLFFHAFWHLNLNKVIYFFPHMFI